LKLDYGGQFEKGHTRLCRTVIGGEGYHRSKRNAVGIEIEIGFVPKAGYVYDCSIVKMGIELKIIIHF